MASDTQAVGVFLNYVPWPSSSQCRRQLHYCGPILHLAADLLPSAKEKWENHRGSTCFQYYPLSFVHTRFGLCSPVSPLNSVQKHPGITHLSNDIWNMNKRISPKDLADCRSLQQSENGRVCPGLSRNRQRFTAALIHQKQFHSHIWAQNE